MAIDANMKKTKFRFGFPMHEQMTDLVLVLLMWHRDAHVRSLVMQRGFSPSLSQAFVAWTAFWLQDPSAEPSPMYLSSLFFNRGSSRNRWLVSRTQGVLPQT